MKSSRNVSLIIGLAVPVLMVVFVAASIYLPALWAPQPATSFVYATGDNYYGMSRYTVMGDKVTKVEVKEPEHAPVPSVTRLFVYDAAARTSTEVSLEEAQQLSLDPRDTSPDGYAVRQGSRGDGVFPFFFSERQDRDAMYLTGHNVSRKLDLQTPNDGGYYYYPRARFLGWIRTGGRHGEK